MEMLDIELKSPDIQRLSSVDEIAAFFARLGYSTDAGIEQTPQNLGITSDDIKRRIKLIRRLAVEDQLLHVYFFEITSITMIFIREIAKCFRNKAGNYLFVLTSDYKRIDFVLLERIAAPPGKNSMAYAVPRILTIDRMKPDSISIRVLMRFTYTASDAISQYRKLLSAYSMAYWSEEYFNNKALFSDYFLMNRLPDWTEWIEELKPHYQNLRKICIQNLPACSSAEEKDIRIDMYEPILKELGFSFEQGKAPSDASHEKPDYYLYASNRASNHDRPLAVALVYSWERFLDGKDEHDQETPYENPSAAVVSLLESNQTPWAIVTNGRSWRLYSQKTHSRATNYYEIDLPEALSLGSAPTADPAVSFRYFYLFFRCKAFDAMILRDEEELTAQSFLDRVLNESVDYSIKLGDRLKERIFEKIFPVLAEGFIYHIRSREGNAAIFAQERLDSIFQGTLTLLYRLLFLFYAESRDLLPARELRGYYEASIKYMRQEIADIAGTLLDQTQERIASNFMLNKYSLYERLTRLFSIVDKGDEKLNVPVYNGGLFLTDADDKDESSEARNARFLHEFAVPDRNLAFAIDLMARDIDEKRQDLAFIDYKSLGVRQLGSMYEGLLEFRLHIAHEKMAIVRGKKTEEIISYNEAIEKKLKILCTGKGKNAEERIIKKNEVYLENDKRERKATGSYYTPEHIVNYIVEHTVGPVLAEKFELLRNNLRDIEREKKSFDDKQKALRQKGLPSEPDSKRKLIGKKFIEDIFSVKVLDPAMGSGHFLVQTVDFITDKMLHFLNAFPGNPVEHFLEQTRETILEEMEKHRITIDATRLTDINLLKRHVLKRCIYGVDINQMAVELAKVSLLLNCFTLGAPLSFLDHHLRCGNSLIGVTIKEVREAIEGPQTTLFGSSFTGLMLGAEKMIEIARLPDITSWDVTESRRKYHEATSALLPFKRILDVYTSRWFGNSTVGAVHNTKIKRDNVIDFLQDRQMEDYLQSDNESGFSPQGVKIFNIAMASAQQMRFFHWELEFPEVFINPKISNERLEDSGFDAVIGNPPYVRQEGLRLLKPALQQIYNDIFDSGADMCIYFILRAYNMLSAKGKASFIISNKWIRTKYGSSLRLWLKDRGIEELIDFGDLPVFPEATTYPCIIIISKKPPDQSFKVALVSSLDYKDLDEYLVSKRFNVFRKNLSSDCWTLTDEKSEALLQKLKLNSISLTEYVSEQIYYGIKTGLNKAFVIDSETKNRIIKDNPNSIEFIKPFLIGEDIKRYVAPSPNAYLILIPKGWTNENSGKSADKLKWFKQKLPALSAHLLSFADKAEKRCDKGDYWWELRACDYYSKFEKSKIIYPNICKGPEFTLDFSFCYANQKCFIIPIEDKYLLGILNSNLFKYLFSKYLPKLRAGYFEPSYSMIKDFPIKIVLHDSNENRILHEKVVDHVDRILKLMKDRRRDEDRQRERISIESDLNQLVFKIYDLTPEEINIVTGSIS